MRLHRLIFILLTIERKGKVTAKELGERLEASIRTIYRDVDTLCEAGIPLVTQTGPYGGISLADGYNTEIRQLQNEDIINLYLNGIGIKAEAASEIAMKSSSSLLKLQNLFSEKDAEAVNTLVNRFYVDNSPWWGKKNKIECIDAIMKSVWESKKLYINYNKINGNSSDRIIRPYGIAVKDNKWYLAAFCESSLALRIFKCDRISDCRLLDLTFIVPDGFSLEKYFKEAITNFQSTRNAEEQFPVTVQLTSSDQYLLRECEVYSMIKTDNTVEATINMYSFKNAIDTFWNILVKSVVISPPKLQKAVRDHLQHTLNRYEG